MVLAMTTANAWVDWLKALYESDYRSKMSMTAFSKIAGVSRPTLFNPYRSSLYPSQGSASAQIGYQNSYTEIVAQLSSPVPNGTTTARLRFMVMKTSLEAAGSTPYDYLVVSVKSADGASTYGTATYSNVGARGLYEVGSITLSNANVLVGQQLLVELVSINDALRYTTWYVDEMEMRFGCGSAVA